MAVPANHIHQESMSEFERPPQSFSLRSHRDARIDQLLDEAEDFVSEIDQAPVQESPPPVVQLGTSALEISEESDI